MPSGWAKCNSQPRSRKCSRRIVCTRSMVRERFPCSLAPHLLASRPRGGASRGRATRSCLAFLGCVAAGDTPIRTSRRLHRSCPGTSFIRRALTNWYGLLAKFQRGVRIRRQQPRGRREPLVFPCAGLAASHIHRRSPRQVILCCKLRTLRLR